MSETRDRLLRAGERLFRAQGYSGTGLKQLASEAQAPWSSMYHFFPQGKEQLAEQAIRYGGELYAQMIRQCFATYILASLEGAIVLSRTSKSVKPLEQTAQFVLRSLEEKLPRRARKPRKARVSAKS